MRIKNTKETYGAVAKFFHWATAFIILGLIIVGLYMVRLSYSPYMLEVYALHKSFGLLVLWLVGLRLIWRSLNVKPAPHQNHTLWEKVSAKIAHIFLYLAMIGMPLSGWLLSSAGQYPIPFFGLQMPDLIDANPAIAKSMAITHKYLAYLLIIVIGLHAAGALKHHVIDKDSTLKRMMAVPMHKIGPYVLTLIMLLFAYGVVSLGVLPALQAKKELAPQISDVAEETVLPVSQESGGWTIAKDQSYIHFTASVYGKEFQGAFKDFDGRILFDPENLQTSTVNINIPTRSVDSQDEERDSQMQGESWFDAEQYSHAIFQARTFEREGDTYIAHGSLKIKDNEVPIDLPFQLTIKNMEGRQEAVMQSEIVLNRLDYGLGSGEWESADTVSHDVSVSIKVIATRDIP